MLYFRVASFLWQAVQLIPRPQYAKSSKMLFIWNQVWLHSYPNFLYKFIAGNWAIDVSKIELQKFYPELWDDLPLCFCNNRWKLKSSIPRNKSTFCCFASFSMWLQSKAPSPSPRALWLTLNEKISKHAGIDLFLNFFRAKNLNV